MWLPLCDAKPGTEVLLLLRYTDEFRKKLSRTDMHHICIGYIHMNFSPNPYTHINPGWYEIVGWRPLPAFPPVLFPISG